MSLFARARNLFRGSRPDTRNLAGGQAHSLSPKLEFASALSTAFLADGFYQAGSDQIARIAALARQLDDPLFAAKAAVFTRGQNGLRSVSHLVAGELSLRSDVKGQPWLRRFYRGVAQRPDDVTETLAYLKAHGRPGLRKLSNAMKRGFGDALSTFDAYQLAKYQAKGREVSLVDAVNLLHPKATEALTALMKGGLKPAETWEQKLTAAGREASAQGLAEDAKQELKGRAWADLLVRRKLGYTAILRNLRNLADQAPQALPLALAFLTDPRQIGKAKVLPFQFVTALKAIEGTQADASAVKAALNAAMDLSLANAPVFEGATLLAVDGSGSMRGRPLKLASLMAAVLFKGQKDCDVLGFADTAAYLQGLNPGDSLGTLAQRIEAEVPHGGTDFHVIFRTAKRKYDRIVILSDMQAWVGGTTPAQDLEDYRVRLAAEPRIFSFDLTGHGTLQFPERGVFALAGFSDAVLAVMKNLEEDPQALVHRIEQIEL